MSKVLAIPDQHFPFAHKDIFPFLKAVVKKYKPDVIINLGDELDMHALSSFEHDPDGFSAGHELKEGMKYLKIMYNMFPKVKVCTSNHTSRGYRRAYKFGIPKAYLKSYKEFLQAPKGWEWADYFEVDGVRYQHGDPYTGQKGAIKAALDNMQSTVIGHIHAFGGIQFSANHKHLVFGFNAGCLIDREAYAFKYAKLMPAKPIIGCGLVINGIPTFIPMQLSRRGGWTGVIS